MANAALQASANQAVKLKDGFSLKRNRNYNWKVGLTN
jgi:hypothetical protein